MVRGSLTHCEHRHACQNDLAIVHCLFRPTPEMEGRGEDWGLLVGFFVALVSVRGDFALVSRHTDALFH